MKEMKGKPSGKGTTLKNALAWIFGSMFFAFFIFAATVDSETDIPKYGMATSVFLYLISAAASISVFVMSIVHLKMYQEKGLAITALVFSSIFLLANLGWAMILSGY